MHWLSGFGSRDGMPGGLNEVSIGGVVFPTLRDGFEQFVCEENAHTESASLGGVRRSFIRQGI
jgi:hypothetical protein